MKYNLMSWSAEGCNLIACFLRKMFDFVRTKKGTKNFSGHVCRSRNIGLCNSDFAFSLLWVLLSLRLRYLVLPAHNRVPSGCHAPGQSPLDV